MLEVVQSYELPGVMFVTDCLETLRQLGRPEAGGFGSRRELTVLLQLGFVVLRHE